MPIMPDPSIVYDEDAQKIVITNIKVSFQELYDALEVVSSSGGNPTPNANAYANANANAAFLRDRDQPAGVMEKIDNHYTIKCDLELDVGAELYGENVNIYFLGKYFQVNKGSSFRLGQYFPTLGRTDSGCKMWMPNIKMEYGFGNKEIIDESSQSGDLYLYNSHIDARGFWAFFRGEDQIVHIVDCIVDGFGRVQGTESIVRNVLFNESHERWGILSPKGTLQEYSDITTKKSKGSSVYFNPKLAESMTIRGGIYDGYDKLVYCESSPESDETITFIDADIRAGYDIKVASRAFVKVAYTYNPIFMKAEGGVYDEPLHVTITDKDSNIMFEENDVMNGLTTELPVFSGGDHYPIYHNPYQVTVQDPADPERVLLQYTLTVNKPMVEIPVIICDRDQEVVYVDRIVEVEVPTSGGGELGSGTVTDDASLVVYVNSPTDDTNNVQKEQILKHVPDGARPQIYTDKTRDAYSARPSYNTIMMRAVRGEIKSIYVWEAESFGPTRSSFTCDLLKEMGVEVIETRGL